jgi:hypothetical protein
MSLYADLGLSSNASAKDIKTAYHRLARQHHPDRGGADDIQFKRISAAYSTLSDPIERIRYDARPRPALAVRIVPVSARTLVRGGLISLVHAVPCGCRCMCDLMGKTYGIEGRFRRVRPCVAVCERCMSKVHVPPGTRDGEIFGDNGHVRFMASAIVTDDLQLVNGRLVARISAPLLEALTGFARTVDGEVVRFGPELFAGRTATISITIEDVDYEVTLRL